MFCVRAILFPPPSVSVGTFFKHLPTLKPHSLKLNPVPDRKSTLSLSTASVNAAAIDTPHFQSLTSHQKHQVRLYIDSLLQCNQVLRKSLRRLFKSCYSLFCFFDFFLGGWDFCFGVKKMNLTAVKEENEVMERHVEDSLAIIDPVRNAYLSHCGSSFEKLNIVDVGSGAGLPGLILAMACPCWKVTLLESMKKRCVFLEHAANLVGLQNVRDRTENLGQNLDFREGFDIAVARAVAEMRVLAEYCLPLVRVGGLFVAAKGHDPQEEVSKAGRAIHLMGASLLKTCSVESHSKYGQRTVIICLKDSPTPRKYPRTPGTPSKLPL